LKFTARKQKQLPARSSKSRPVKGATPAPADFSLQVEIGQQVRELRHDMDLTVAELSSSAGLSPGMLSKIENGTVSPSLATLQTLAQALNVPVGHLFRDTQNQPNCSFVKSGTGARINRRGTKAGHLYNLLVGHSYSPDAGTGPYLITLGEDAAPHTSFRHHGNEFIYMLSGRLRYRHGDRHYTLEPGDALFFDASVRHGPEEIEESPVKYLSVLAIPAKSK
jgi:transcriptional regulator with XRE-family HTH domain